MGSPQGPAMTKVSSPMASNEHTAHGSLANRDIMPVYVKELIAGGFAGGFAKTAVAPLERTKILFQTRHSDFHNLGVWKSLGKILQNEGVFGFYKGNGASPIVDLLAGSVAGGTAVLCTYPLDLVRTKLAYQVTSPCITGRENNLKSHCVKPAYQGVADVFRKVYREGGFRGLYRGVGPTLFGILPYAGLKFYVYEELKSRVPVEHQTSIAMKLACGALAGLLGQTFTYPVDVVRRQMQVQRIPVSQGHTTSLQLAEPQINGMMKGLAIIIRTQGWRQMFAGLSINYLKIVPSVAIGFSAYDAMKSWLGCPPREKTRVKTSL